ncbi:hypothetical protein BKA93DRAFT_748308 [Sparassis latifolia]
MSPTHFNHPLFIHLPSLLTCAMLESGPEKDTNKTPQQSNESALRVTLDLFKSIRTRECAMHRCPLSHLDLHTAVYDCATPHQSKTARQEHETKKLSHGLRFEILPHTGCKMMCHAHIWPVRQSTCVTSRRIQDQDTSTGALAGEEAYDGGDKKQTRAAAVHDEEEGADTGIKQNDG